MERKIAIKDSYPVGSDYVFCGIKEANCETEEYSFTDDGFYIEEGDIECFLWHFFIKHFDGSMPINQSRRDVAMIYGNAGEFVDHVYGNFFTVEQIKNMLSDILLCADLLENNYAAARGLDFTKNFSIFYMTEGYDPNERQTEEAIEKNIGAVIDFYRRFAARMNQFLQNNPQIEYIAIIGP